MNRLWSGSEKKKEYGKLCDKYSKLAHTSAVKVGIIASHDSCMAQVNKRSRGDACLEYWTFSPSFYPLPLHTTLRNTAAQSFLKTPSLASGCLPRSCHNARVKKYHRINAIHHYRMRNIAIHGVETSNQQASMSSARFTPHPSHAACGNLQYCTAPLS